MEYPDKFAGIVPVSGSGSKERLSLLKHVPVWAFHGALDEAVPIGEVEDLLKELVLCRGEGTLMVYPAGGHDIWSEAYGTEELYSSFFRKSLQ